MNPSTLKKLNAMRGIDPIAERSEAIRAIAEYLSPISAGGCGRRAHQMTINGLTYPFVRRQNFAAVPDVPKNRRYDMYASLHLIRTGDLLFFFQSDPQRSSSNIDNRRGIRGIYVATSTPYRSSRKAQITSDGFTYALLHKCPKCGTHFGTMSDTCALCSVTYPCVKDGSHDRHYRVMSSHIDVEPLYAFERSVSDERAYADLSDEGLIWIGRHDNQMGPGKGSSIRHLLPGDALKITRLLTSERNQVVGKSCSKPNSKSHRRKLRHDNGLSIDFLLCDRNGRLCSEDQLNFAAAMQLKSAATNLRQALEPLLQPGVQWVDLAYESSMFPWGYTGGTADYVLLFQSPKGLANVFILEFKKGTEHDRSVLQVNLYVERVLQALFMNSKRSISASRRNPVQVQPLVIAWDRKTIRTGDPKVALPNPYEARKNIWPHGTLRAHVEQTRFLRYRPTKKPSASGSAYFLNFKDLGFEFLDESKTMCFSWRPTPGSVGTAVEMEQILKGDWADQRSRVKDKGVTSSR